MPWELIGYYTNIPLVALVFARLSALIMFQPILGSLGIPMQARGLLVIALAVIALPYAAVTAALPDTLAGLAVGMGRELLIGGLMGLVAAVCFLGLQMGGLLVAQESGLAFGQVADPNSSDQMNVLSSFYLQFGSVVFLVAGGHRALVAASLETFRGIPLLSGPDLTPIGTELLLTTLALGGEIAVRVAAPAVITLFLVNLAMGFVARTVPQLNIMTLGFSMKSLIGFAIIAISLPAASAAFLDVLEQTLDGLYAMVSP